MTESHYFTASDGARLHYLQAGKGELLLMLPGGGLSADIFRPQIDAFADDYRVISLDKRGHGKSEKVEYGYRVSRFAKDVRDLLEHLGNPPVSLLCHSLGASAMYNYMDMYGCDGIKKLIIVDQPTVILINPAWSKEECQQYGAIYDAKTLHELTNNFIHEDAGKLNQMIIDNMTTRFATEAQKQMILQCLDIPGKAAAQLYFNNVSQDFRDVLRKISVPTLFITGEASLHPWQSHQWMHEQVAGSELKVFTEQEGGNHFMYVENPHGFNAVVADFLSK